ncbi:Endonuclease/exonuclease/phosphatase family protein [Pelomyxa schiedti]|nr:Endonuclease/exonuclease/phosphatase family protein [Pelomyxa schiedti]
MKRRRRGNVVILSSTSTSPQQRQQQVQRPVEHHGPATHGSPLPLDQVVPASVMDVIAAFLLCPPFPPHPCPASPLPHKNKNTSKSSAAAAVSVEDDDKPSVSSAGRFSCICNFALCSRRCLAACDRVSVVMRARSFVRPNLGLVTAPIAHRDDQVTEASVQRDREDERDLAKAVRIVQRAVHSKRWIVKVNESILKAESRPFLRPGMNPKIFEEKVHAIVYESTWAESTGETRDNALKGAVWFYPAPQAGTTSSSQRVFFYCYGMISTAVPPGYPEAFDYSPDPDDRSSYVGVWYCVEECGSVPRPPPCWMPENLRALKDEELEPVAPWIKLAHKHDLVSNWYALPDNNVENRLFDMRQWPAAVTLCALAGFPIDRCGDLLNTLVKCANNALRLPHQFRTETFSTTMAAITNVVSSAVVVSPPAEQWGPIQAIRKEHDKAYQRWMPHINMLYPFWPEKNFPQAAGKLREALANFPQFTVEFNQLSFFEHGPTSCTFFALPVTEPVNALKGLEELLLQTFPGCTDLSAREGGFHPHLTLGQCRGKAATERQIKTLNWKPMKFTVKSIQMISRTATTPFAVKFDVPLLAKTPIPPPIDTTITIPPPPPVEVPPPPKASAPPKATAPKKPSLPPKPKVPQVVVANDPLALQDQAVESSLPKIRKWLKKHPEQAPKTRAKFTPTMQKFCRGAYTMREEPLVDYLVAVGAVVKTGTKLKINTAPPAHAAKPKRASAYPEVLVRVQDKAQKWCLAQVAHPPKSDAALRSAIGQLLIHRDNFDPLLILDKLLEEANVTEDPEGNLTYSLP